MRLGATPARLVAVVRATDEQAALADVIVREEARNSTRAGPRPVRGGRVREIQRPSRPTESANTRYLAPAPGSLCGAMTHWWAHKDCNDFDPSMTYSGNGLITSP
jgi:hypothetical protein